MRAIQVNSECIDRINRGDETAFAELYDAYFTYLCVCATAFTHDPECAKDLVNDLFMGVWSHRETLRFPAHAYLMQALRNKCLNYLRTLKSQQRTIDAYQDDLLAFRIERIMTDTPLQYVEIAELSASIRRIADSLPEQCRRIFQLYFYEGLSTRDIARETGLTASTVRVQLKIALDRMRRKLGPALFSLLLCMLGR